MKKLLSIVLVCVMIFTTAIPALTASAAENYVTIYVEGYGGALVDENGEYIWYDGPKESMLTGLTAVLEDLLKDLAIGAVTGDFTEYCDRLYNAMAPAFAELKLDKNGEASDGSGIGYDMLTRGYSVKYNHFSTGSIDFRYDWRLSCEDNAEILEAFIDRVCREKGYDKVNLVGRCLGGSIISAYLENADNLDKINDVVMYIPSTEGVDFIGALFSGQVVLDGDAIDNFVSGSSMKNNDILAGLFEDDSLYETLTVVVNFINEVYVLDFGADIIEAILEAVKDNVLARIVRDTYGSFVGYWNMVPDEYLEDAIAFVYNTPELQEEYDGMISRIRSFNKNVQVTSRGRMLELTEDGMDIMVISKYNFANLPLSKNALAQSDGTALTTATSFGATTANLGETLSEEYIENIPEEKLKYLSADTMIDASTCVLPEKTWFVKNLIHGTFPPCVDKLMEEFMSGDDMTIDSNEAYPQFIKYDAESDTLSAVEGLDDGDLIVRNTILSKLTAFFKFFSILIDFFQKLLAGEIDLGGIMG